MKLNKKRNSKRNIQGYVTLTAVLVLLAVSISASVGLLLISTTSNKNSLTQLNMDRAKSAADSCANRALNELRLDSAYAAGETITLLGGKSSCTVNAILGVANSNRTLRVTGTSGGSTSRLQIVITTINPIVIGSWKYLSDF